MQNFLRLWDSSGLAQIHAGQVFMIAIGLLLLFLAIRRASAVIAGAHRFWRHSRQYARAGMAWSAVENAVYAGDPVLLAEIARALGVSLWPITKGVAGRLPCRCGTLQLAVEQLAEHASFSNGMLYNFYTVAIASGVAPGDFL